MIEITGTVNKSSEITGVVMKSNTITGNINGLLGTPSGGGDNYLFPTFIWDNTLTWLNTKTWKNTA